MKKTILVGLSLVLGFNSIALAQAQSDRVNSINQLTVSERQQLMLQLREEIHETRVELKTLELVIKEAKRQRLDAAQESLVATAASAVSGISAIFLATKVPALKKTGQHIEAALASAVVGGLSIMFGKNAYNETTNSTEIAKFELAEEENRKQLEANIPKLYKQLDELQMSLEENLQD